MNLNKVMLIGNLTRDPEVRTAPTGTQVATFSIATNMVWKDQSGQRQEKAEFHNIVAWRRLAEICAQYLKKGARIYVEGRLQTRDWTGQDGVKRYRTEVVAENMIMLDRMGGNQSYGGGAPFGGQSQGSSYGNEAPMEDIGPADDEIRVENIPF